MQKNELVKPERVDFIGNYEQDNIDDFLNYIEGSDMVWSYPLYDAPLSSIKNALQEYAHHQSIDLSNKLVSNENIHFLTSCSFENLLARLGKERLRLSGFSKPISLNVYINDVLGLAQNLFTVNHELIHCIGYNLCNLIVDGGKIKPTVIRSGFYNDENNKFFGLNEGMVEFINGLLINNEWINHDDLKDFRKEYNISIEEGNSYPWMTNFVSCLLHDLSDKTGEDYNSVLQTFYKGYILGGDEPFKLIRKTYGKKGLKRIAKLKPGEHEKVKRTARKLGIKYY